MNQTATARQVEPEWLATAEEDERAILLAFGVHLTDEGSLDLPSAQCAIDASASQLLRTIGAVEHDLARYAAARAEEQTLIQLRYEQFTAKLIERKARLEGIVRQYATMSDFGDKKSRELAYGTYGVRAVPDHLSIADKKKLLGWCHLSAPDLITIKQEETIAQKKVEAHFKATGELPDGCEFTAAHDEPFLRLVAPVENAA